MLSNAQAELYYRHFPNFMNSDMFQFLAILTLSDSDTFQFGKKMDPDTFQFLHFPVTRHLLYSHLEKDKTLMLTLTYYG